MKTYSNLVLILALVIGLTFSFILAWSFYDLETRSITAQFKQDVDDQISSIEREINLNFEAVYALKGLYDSSEYVTAAEFTRFSSAILARHPNIQALEWIPKISHNDRSTYETQRKNDFPEFSVTERSRQGKMVIANDRAEYFPVYYVEPFLGNESALGFDLASNPRRLEALIASQKSGKLVSTASITLVQETSNQKGFLAFLPVYQGRPTTLDQRAESLLGFVLGVFRIGDLVKNSVSHSSQRDINFTLIDVETSPPEELYRYDVPLTDVTETSTIQYQTGLTPLGDRQWNILASPTTKYFYEHRSSTPFTIFLLVSVFIFFGIAYIFLLTQHSASIEKAVLERTLELNNAKNELERMTLVDGLTGVANRRHFDSYLEQEWARATRYKQPISLIMIDIDYFKQFNDHYGHLPGDSCLKIVASTVEDTVQRASDLVARFGGEEFAIILPNIEDAYVLAELCRENIEKANIAHERSKVADHITVSLGCATLIPDKEMKLNSLISRADQALYEAKHSGRNQTCVL
ncbi:hypothetical protein A9Q79_04885 [Methylophaga sp. 42_25_T18]|nr:hypothetical protein A9Q79_04885 [Methylophaga sp. 42_25_T18]OUR85742.1 hypothetical protein A9Q92_07530 [Methylophaga sp. 42_8_T64]